ncbi:MAG: hypothetical protein CL693_17835 [Cellvibrionaceae bacterium]|nr:hypothetical protein [Cellvibrionaceae bacterium]|tara:strand:- start:2015 stop:2848 length:834 start_codon:yes stop_codon:yes gene_type:complete
MPLPILSDLNTAFCRCLAPVVAGLIISANVHSQAPSFTVLCAVPEQHESFEPIHYAYSRALSELGYQLTFKVITPARTFHDITHGQADAICLTSNLSLSTFDTGAGAPLNIVLGKSQINGWSVNPVINVNRERITSDNSLFVGHIKNQSSDFYLRSYNVKHGVATKNVSMAAKMLAIGRLDVMLLIETETYETTLSYWLEQHQVGLSKRLKKTYIADANYTPYLHKRHQRLKKPLERSLTKIVQSHGGAIARHNIAQWSAAAADYFNRTNGHTPHDN